MNSATTCRQISGTSSDGPDTSSAGLLSTDVMQISCYERGIGLPSLETCVQLAAVLEVSTDELLLGRERRGAKLEISDVRLLDKFRHLQHLDKRDREAVIILIDGVLASRSVESAIASARQSLLTMAAPARAHLVRSRK